MILGCPKRPRIGIVFFGIPRSGSISMPTIQQKIIGPARAIGDVFIRYHFYDQSRVYRAPRKIRSALALRRQ